MPNVPDAWSPPTVPIGNEGDRLREASPRLALGDLATEGQTELSVVNVNLEVGQGTLSGDQVHFAFVFYLIRHQPARATNARSFFAPLS